MSKQLALHDREVEFRKSTAQTPRTNRDETIQVVVSPVPLVEQYSFELIVDAPERSDSVTTLALSLKLRYRVGGPSSSANIFTEVMVHGRSIAQRSIEHSEDGRLQLRGVIRHLSPSDFAAFANKIGLGRIIVRSSLEVHSRTFTSEQALGELVVRGVDRPPQGRQLGVENTLAEYAPELGELLGDHRIRSHGARLLTSTRPPSATELQFSGLTRPYALNTVTANTNTALTISNHMVMADFVWAPTTQDQPLPIIRDPNAKEHVDRLDAAKRWYCPRFELVLPAAQAALDSSPFSFLVTRQGAVTGQGGTRPGVHAAITCRVRATRPSDVSGTAVAVPLGNLSATLEIPFREAGASTAVTRSFPASVSTRTDGDFDITLELLDDWARLAYGSISTPGFQEIVPRVQISYAFSAYVPLVSAPIKWMAPLLLTMLPDVSFKLAKARDDKFLLASKLKVSNDLVSKYQGPLVTSAKPNDEADELLLQTHVRTESTSLVVPCAEFGIHYREKQGDVTQMLGCVDALKLGETSTPPYAEVASIRHSRYRVYRSTAVANRFLVVPASYRIARLEPDRLEMAYRPAIHVAAAVDAQTSASRYIVSAVLQPDIDPVDRRTLEAELRRHVSIGADPELEWPTDPGVQAAFAFEWDSAGALPVPVVVMTWEGFRVTLECALTDALLVNDRLNTTGIACSVKMAFAGGVTARTSLVLDSQPTGPWTSGPVQVEVTNSGARLTNRIERAVTVKELVGFDAQGREHRMLVGQSPQPGQSIEVPGIAPGTTDFLAVVDVSNAPLRITESSVFAQDVSLELRALATFDFASRNIAVAVVKIRLRDETITRSIRLTAESPTSSLLVTLPITTYLEPQSLEWSVEVQTTNGETRSGPAHSHRLSTDRGLLSVTPDFLPV